MKPRPRWVPWMWIAIIAFCVAVNALAWQVFGALAGMLP